MSTNRLSPQQRAARDTMFSDVAHLSSGQGANGGWGFGMSVRAFRCDCAPVGQFRWFGGTGTTVYADPVDRLTGVLLTQVGLSTADSPRAMSDFWTTLYQAIGAERLRPRQPVGAEEARSPGPVPEGLISPA
ncbi:hypothetical protein [Streptomyces sp. NPDC002057]|uniref:hypothetical protein n=1 Tax=Streptomyces sp. NPDC002057 TaxID=3154664 RepID=UPI00331A2CA1